MTIVYIPRLIESAEQADALPQDTVATKDGGWPRIKDDDRWETPVEDHTSADMIGWTALVPVEAVTITRQAELCKPGRAIRYITAWEEA